MLWELNTLCGPDAELFREIPLNELKYIAHIAFDGYCLCERREYPNTMHYYITLLK